MTRRYRIEVAVADPAADVEGRSVLSTLQDLGLADVESVRTARVYAVEGDLDEAGAQRLARELLADKVAERYAVDQPVLPEATGIAVDVVRKPGVMDPVQVSALKGARELNLPLDQVRTARHYVFATPSTPEQIVQAARRVIANDVIEDVVVGHPDLISARGGSYQFQKTTVSLRDAEDDQLARISREGDLYLSVVEMRTIQEHFRKLDRDPTDVELETLAQTWSEHCVHKTLRGIVTMDDGQPRRYENLLKETIARATEELNADWCLSVFKDNAGTIALDDEDGVCFKVETHNHPSAIEPYGGAGTGLGGVIRDVLGNGLGAAPVANTDVFCFAPLDTPNNDLPPGTLHPKRVMKGVVAGVRDYGNRMGIPTVGGAVLFDERYLGNPLVYCGTVGLIPRDKVEKAAVKGDLIVVAGGRTGRDGIHGATFSSGELHEESEMVSSGAVQIGNAIEEKKVLEAILTARDEELYTSITDCGAGGLSSAVGEMGEELGAEVELKKVPLKYDGLSYTEIWISEAQERMVMAVPPSKVDRLMEVFAGEEVEATVIGTFTGDHLLRLYYDGEQVAELDMDFLHNGLPRVERTASWAPPTQSAPELPKDIDYSDVLRRILAAPNVCSKDWVIRQYDHEVQAGTIVKPLLGVNNDSPSDGAVVAPKPGSWRAVAIGHGINPSYGDLDPYRMAASAIDEAVRNVVSLGGRPDRIALLDNFSWGNADKPDRMGALVRACEACRDVAIAFGTPFISGKDSLNNEYRVGDQTICIPHTLLISAMALVDDFRRCVTMDAKKADSAVFLVGLTRDELGGSHLHRVLGLDGGEAPTVDLELAPQLHRAMARAIAEGLVRACHDLSEGGLAVAAAEMAFAGGVGMDLDVADMPTEGALPPAARLFSESNSRYLCEVAPEQIATFEATFAGLPCARIGTVVGSPTLKITDGKEVVVAGETDVLKQAWLDTLKVLDRS